MKIKQFKEELLKGNGACVIEVYNNPNKYKNALLYACKNVISYDPQSNGTHADYVYNMISLYDNKTVFVDVIANEYSKNKIDYWLFDHLTYLLFRLENDSYKAHIVLLDKLNELYLRIINGKVDNEEEGHLELLLVNMLDDKSYYDIAIMVGQLLKDYKDNVLDMCWILSCLENKYVKRLNRRKNTNEYLKYLFDEEYLVLDRKKEFKNFELKLFSIEEYKKASSIQEKKQILYRLNKELSDEEELNILLNDMNNNKELSELILDKLSKFKHLLLRKIALENKNNIKYLPMLISNSSKEDMEYINEKVREIPIDFKDEYNSHYVFGFILDAYKNDVKIDKELLRYVYENLYCSYCKYEAFVQLRKRNALTNRMILEATYDANDEIKNAARKILGI